MEKTGAGMCRPFFCKAKILGRKYLGEMVLCDKCFRERNQGSPCTNCPDNSWGERNLLEWLYVTNAFVKEIKVVSARIALAIRGAKETC